MGISPVLSGPGFLISPGASERAQRDPMPVAARLAGLPGHVLERSTPEPTGCPEKLGSARAWSTKRGGMRKGLGRDSGSGVVFFGSGGLFQQGSLYFLLNHHPQGHSPWEHRDPCSRTRWFIIHIGKMLGSWPAHCPAKTRPAQSNAFQFALGLVETLADYSLLPV